MTDGPPVASSRQGIMDGMRTPRVRSPAVLVGVAVAALIPAGCSTSSKSTNTTTIAPSTTAAPTTAPAPTTSLTVSGTGPIPQEPPFYPQITVSSVSCGQGPNGNGRFVRVDLPAGAAPTPARSAMAQPTAVLIVPGKATLIDHTNKTLYEQDDASIAPDHQGALVLSLTNTTSTGGDGRVVETGAVDVSGDYGCPAKDIAYPGT
jgi:hypothetical protein